MSHPEVSVIIPVYNRQLRMLEAVESVLSQDEADFEIIIVDDGSDEAIDSRHPTLDRAEVRLIRHASNKGPAAARNSGAEVARGRWISWLDSDDLWFPDKLSRQLKHLNQLGAEADNMALGGAFEYFLASNARRLRYPIPSRDEIQFFGGCWFSPGSTVILSRDLFERVGRYDERLRRLEDLDWFARMALMGGRFEPVPGQTPVAQIRNFENPSYEIVRSAGQKLLSKYRDEDNVIPKAALRNLAAYLEIEYAASAIKHDHNYPKAFKHIAASWWLRPRSHLHLYQFWK